MKTEAAVTVNNTLMNVELAGNCTPKLIYTPGRNRKGMLCLVVADDRFAPAYCKGDIVFCRPTSKGLKSEICIADEDSPARCDYWMKKIEQMERREI